MKVDVDSYIRTKLGQENRAFVELLTEFRSIEEISWAFVAICEEMISILDTVLKLDPDFQPPYNPSGLCAGSLLIEAGDIDKVKLLIAKAKSTVEKGLKSNG